MAARKHRKINSKGETLVEALVSLTILSLAVLCMTYMITLSNNFNARARERNANIYKESCNIEQNTNLTDIGAGKITIKIRGNNIDVPVNSQSSGNLFIFTPTKETP